MKPLGKNINTKQIKDLCNQGQVHEALAICQQMTTTELRFIQPELRIIYTHILHDRLFDDQRTPRRITHDDLQRLTQKPFRLPPGVAIFPHCPQGEKGKAAKFWGIQIAWSNSLEIIHSIPTEIDDRWTKARDLVFNRIAPHYQGLSDRLEFRLLPDISTKNFVLEGHSLDFACIAAWSSFIFHRPLPIDAFIFTGTLISEHRGTLSGVQPNSLISKFKLAETYGSKLVIHQQQVLPSELSQQVDIESKLVRITNIEDIFKLIYPEYESLQLGQQQLIHSSQHNQVSELDSNQRQLVSLVAHSYDHGLKQRELFSVNLDFELRLETLKLLDKSNFIKETPQEEWILGDHAQLSSIIKDLNQSDKSHRLYLELWRHGKAPYISVDEFKAFHHALNLKDPYAIEGLFRGLKDQPSQAFMIIKAYNEHTNLDWLLTQIKHRIDQAYNAQEATFLMAWHLWRSKDKTLQNLGMRIIDNETSFEKMMTLKHIFFTILHKTMFMGYIKKQITDGDLNSYHGRRFNVNILLQLIGRFLNSTEITPKFRSLIDRFTRLKDEMPHILEIMSDFHKQHQAHSMIKPDDNADPNRFETSTEECFAELSEGLWTHIVYYCSFEFEIPQLLTLPTFVKRNNTEHKPVTFNYHFQESSSQTYWFTPGHQQLSPQVLNLEYGQTKLQVREFPSIIADRLKHIDDLSTTLTANQSMTGVYQLHLELKQLINSVARLCWFTLLTQLDHEQKVQAWDATSIVWYDHTNTLNVIRVFLKLLKDYPELENLKFIKALVPTIKALEPIQIALRWLFYQAAPISNEDSYAQQLEMIKQATYQTLNTSCFKNDLCISVKTKEYGVFKAQGFIHDFDHLPDYCTKPNRINPISHNILNECILSNAVGTQLSLSPYLFFTDQGLWLYQGTKHRSKIKKNQFSILSILCFFSASTGKSPIKNLSRPHKGILSCDHEKYQIEWKLD